MAPLKGALEWLAQERWRSLQGRLWRLQETGKHVAARPLGSTSLVVERAGRSVGFIVNDPPAPAEVLANYTRGWFLFGSHGYGKFEWRSFPRRGVITPETAKVPKRVQRWQRQLDLEIRFGEDFEQILDGCRGDRRSWITPELAAVYQRLNEMGFVLTVGAYSNGDLVGGIWGLLIGGTFGALSMFHTEANAGSILSAALMLALTEGRIAVLEVGPANQHWTRYGCYDVSVEEFCEMVWRTAAPRNAHKIEAAQ